jgi:FKBP-type peptidyl-prolyl cis-trans isomerase FkpA
MFKKLLLVFFLVIQSLSVMAVDINIKDETMNQKITELKLIDSKVGEGRGAEKGLSITVHYTGWLYDANAKDFKGQKFDSSLDRREPFTFILGVGQVIRGWDEGFKGMQIGGKRTIQIPSEFGYGRRGAGNVIPPNADLIFDVELLDIK